MCCSQPASQASQPQSPLCCLSNRRPPSPLLAPPTAASNESFPSVAGLSEALYAGAVTIDLRNPVSSEATGGALRMLDGALSAPWDRAIATMPLTALPSDKAEPIVLVCRSGTRAAKAASYLADAGYTRVLNGGGPEGPAELWQVRRERHEASTYYGYTY